MCLRLPVYHSCVCYLSVPMCVLLKRPQAAHTYPRAACPFPPHARAEPDGAAALLDHPPARPWGVLLVHQGAILGASSGPTSACAHPPAHMCAVRREARPSGHGMGPTHGQLAIAGRRPYRPVPWSTGVCPAHLPARSGCGVLLVDLAPPWHPMRLGQCGCGPRRRRGCPCGRPPIRTRPQNVVEQSGHPTTPSLAVGTPIALAAQCQATSGRLHWWQWNRHCVLRLLYGCRQRRLPVRRPPPPIHECVSGGYPAVSAARVEAVSILVRGFLEHSTSAVTHVHPPYSCCACLCAYAPFVCPQSFQWPYCEWPLCESAACGLNVGQPFGNDLPQQACAPACSPAHPVPAAAHYRCRSGVAESARPMARARDARIRHGSAAPAA